MFWNVICKIEKISFYAKIDKKMFTPIDAITLMHCRQAQPPPPPSQAFKFPTLQLCFFKIVL